jgi:hypothetical protein
VNTPENGTERVFLWNAACGLPYVENEEVLGMRIRPVLGYMEFLFTQSFSQALTGMRSDFGEMRRCIIIRAKNDLERAASMMAGMGEGVSPLNPVIEYASKIVKYHVKR